MTRGEDTTHFNHFRLCRVNLRERHETIAKNRLAWLRFIIRMTRARLENITEETRMILISLDAQKYRQEA